jgi:putative transposase
MPEYRRIAAAGAQVFFTLVTHGRRAILATPLAVRLLREAVRSVKRKHPFGFDAIVILPDHLHAIWTMPLHESDFSIRWSLIKRSFTDAYLADGGCDGAQSASRRMRGERAIWQRRFWDHVIRDERDLEAHMDYIHYNPVKHGYAACPHAWQYSSFATWVKRGAYDAEWMCTCGARAVEPPDFSGISNRAGE